jgi:hypothetical protein
MSSRKDYRYVISDERLRAYAQVRLLDRLRWLDELVRFTQAWRMGPRVELGTEQSEHDR